MLLTFVLAATKAAVLAFKFQVLRLCQTSLRTGRPTYFKAMIDAESGYLIIRQALISIRGSVEWFQYGQCVLYLSHAMLALAELIVCSMRGFACILTS